MSNKKKFHRSCFSSHQAQNLRRPEVVTITGTSIKWHDPGTTLEHHKWALKSTPQACWCDCDRCSCSCNCIGGNNTIVAVPHYPSSCSCCCCCCTVTFLQLSFSQTGSESLKTGLIEPRYSVLDSKKNSDIDFVVIWVVHWFSMADNRLACMAPPYQLLTNRHGWCHTSVFIGYINIS